MPETSEGEWWSISMSPSITVLPMSDEEKAEAGEQEASRGRFGFGRALDEVTRCPRKIPIGRAAHTFDVVASAHCEREDDGHTQHRGRTPGGEPVEWSDARL